MYDYTLGIPLFNDEVHIHTLLDNIENQQVNFKLKVIVYDDCSKMIFKPKREYENFRLEYLRGNKNKGPAYARNELIKASPSIHLLLIDSDCIFEDEHSLQLLYDLKEKADISYPNIFEKSGRFSSIIHPLDDQLFPTMTTCFQVNIATLKSRRIQFRRVFDFFCEDFCFFIECKKRNVSMIHIPQLTVIHRRPTTGKCPIRLTRERKVNLVKSFLLLRLLHPGYVQSDWYNYLHLLKIWKNNSGKGLKDHEYGAVMAALVRLPIKLPQILLLKFRYAIDDLRLFFENKL